MPAPRRHRSVTGTAVASAFVPAVALVMLLTAIAPLPAAEGGVPAQDAVREVQWEDLMPEDWDPLSGLEALLADGVQDLADGSAEAMALMSAYQEAVRSAPVVGALDGQRIRLPGFVVPLDFDDTEISEFLLVPYFGACIHVPPPPSNQIVYVKTVAGYPLKELFDPVWVTGVLSTQAHLNEVGDAGYTLQATIIEPY